MTIKRLLDIVLSATLLVMLLPLMIVVSIIIVLESPGAPIYVSERVGRDCRKFRFYKFRSMRKKSDEELESLKNRNTYLDIYADPETINLPMQLSEVILYSDNYKVNEFDYLQEVAKEINSSFIKVEKDPRITGFGKFIRATSIDELPQLINILKGDMSFVGNRPLSMAEAELLTTNKFAKRFDCPAGLTGLWQTRKDKDNMTPDTRRRLDIEYAEKCSLSYDIKLIISTIVQVLTKNNE